VVVDTSAVVAILADEAEAGVLARAIADAPAAVMSVVNYVELMVVALSRGLAGRAEIEELLGDAGIAREGVTLAQSELAIEAFERFGKGRHGASLNFGDCFAYALAKARAEPLLFKGRDFSRTDIQSAL
jgi:ribonuclease VapC